MPAYSCGEDQCVTLNVIPRSSNGSKGANWAQGVIANTTNVYDNSWHPDNVLAHSFTIDPLVGSRKTVSNYHNENPFSYLPTRYQIANEFLSTLNEKGNLNYLDDFIVDALELAFNGPGGVEGPKSKFSTEQCNSTYDLLL